MNEYIDLNIQRDSTCERMYLLDDAMPKIIMTLYESGNIRLKT